MISLPVFLFLLNFLYLLSLHIVSDSSTLIAGAATADLLTVWLGNMIDFLEPDVIVLRGGVAQLMSEFFARIQRLL